MKTLKEAVEQSKCRKGKSAGTTKRGAYWLAADAILLRHCGGDGIGTSAPTINWYLELRHYRGGEVRPTLNRHAWHQNGSWSGGGDDYYGAPELCDCNTVEEVIVALKDKHPNDETCYSDRYEDDLTSILTGLGMEVAAKSPDEI